MQKYKTMTKNSEGDFTITERQMRCDPEDHVRVACVKDDGFIYMFRDGEIVQRPKRLYGDQTEREISALIGRYHGYTRVEPAEFDRLSAGAPLNEERSK